MTGESVTQGVGKTLAKQIRLSDALTPSAAYQPTDVLTCSIWEGGNEASLSNPRTEWNPTLGPPDFFVELVPGDTADLTPGVYSIGVIVSRPSTGQTATVWQSSIEVLPRPGIAPTEPVYIQLSDLMVEMPMISSYQQQFRDETGFETQRARARRELDELVHRNVRGVAGITSNIYPVENPYRFLIKSPVIVGYLKNNYLVLSQPLIDHQTLLTISFIFRGQVPANPELFMDLANQYKVRAELALRGATAEIHGPKPDGTGAGTYDGLLLALVDFSSVKCLRA